MVGIPRHAEETHDVSLQKLQTFMDECTALVELHEQVSSSAAKGRMMMRTMDGNIEAEKLEELQQAVAGMEQREELVLRLLQDRLGGASFEETADRMHLQTARMNKARELRTELATLRVALELEIVAGQLPPEQRREVEAALQTMRQRYEATIQQALLAIPGPKLVQV